MCDLANLVWLVQVKRIISKDRKGPVWFSSQQSYHHRPAPLGRLYSYPKNAPFFLIWNAATTAKSCGHSSLQKAPTPHAMLLPISLLRRSQRASSPKVQGLFIFIHTHRPAPGPRTRRPTPSYAYNTLLLFFC